MEKKLTIITPTYNRAFCLDELFESLVAQECSRFQWILVDDGSQDNTRNWFNQLPDTRFEKIYLYKENGGKHKALNFCHPYIQGDYVMIVDSDDVLSLNAVQVILTYWGKYENDDSVSGITFLRGTKSGSEYKRFRKHEFSSNIIVELNKGMRGEFAETVRTSFFKKHQFPEFKLEKYMPESWLWITIGERTKTVYVDEVVYLFEYLDGGLTRSGRKLRVLSPQGMMLHANLLLKKEFALKIRAKAAISYMCYAMCAREAIGRAIKRSNSLVFSLIATFPALILYIVWGREISRGNKENEKRENINIDANGS